MLLAPKKLNAAAMMVVISSAFSATPGCQTLPFADDQPGPSSSVEYVSKAPRRDVPLRLPAAAASYVETRQPGQPAKARPVVVERHGGSSVRYEPINRPDAITSERLWGNNEDHDRIDPSDPSDATDPTDPTDLSDRFDGRDDEIATTGTAKSDTLASSSESSAGMAAKTRANDVPMEDRPGSRRPSKPTRNESVDASTYGPRFTDEGIAFPYPTGKFFRGFGGCRGRRHHHEGIDLGGVGPLWGIGTPIRSMARAEVLFIGTGEIDPDQFGHPDKRSGEALRGDRMLPRSLDIEGYGTVYFFTRTKGRWRSGTILVTRALEGPLAGHIIRYLHLAVIRPDLDIGAILEPGDELGLMGGTGVQESAPHLHLDIAAPDGRRLDVAPILGLNPTASCKDEPPQMLAKDSSVEPTVIKQPRTSRPNRPAAPARETEREVPPERLAARSPSRAHDPYAHIPGASASTGRDESRTARVNDNTPTTSQTPGVFNAGAIPLSKCKSTTRTEDFASGKFTAHSVDLELERSASLTIEVLKKGGRWKPKIEVSGGEDKSLASGKIGKKAVSSVKASPGRTTVKVTSWDGTPPPDAAYTLKITEKCRSRR